MRIISGSARGMVLRVPKGEVRPTTDRVREALFSILGARVEGARVLDLFCGSGALALEALSRGAASARLVDQSAASCRTASENARRLGFSNIAVTNCDCMQFVNRERGVYDLVFADPPYCKFPGDRDMIAGLMAGRLRDLLAPDGIFVAEAQVGYGVGAQSSRTFEGWELADCREYGNNTLLFYTPLP